jgi:hypothetical protein
MNLGLISLTAPWNCLSMMASPGFGIRKQDIFWKLPFRFLLHTFFLIEMALGCIYWKIQPPRGGGDSISANVIRGGGYEKVEKESKSEKMGERGKKVKAIVI